VRYRADGSPRCHNCGDSPIAGGWRCEACAESHRENEAARRAALRKRGKCLVCGKRAARGKRHCSTHLAYYRERMRSA